MPKEISGTKMALEIRNISSNRTEVQEQRRLDSSVENNSSTTANEQSATSDTVSLSQRSQQVQALISSISEQPTTDSDRIQSLRSAIDSGTYSVSAESIANKLLSIDFGNRNQD